MEGAWEKVRRRASVVGQDKSSVTLRFTPRPFHWDLRLFARNERITRRALHNVTHVMRHNVAVSGSDASFRWSRRQLSGPIAGLAITAVSAVLLTVAANILHLRITLTDSAAPAGIYRVIDSPPARGVLVAACLPIAVARTGLTRGYLGAGDCPAGAEPVAKMIGAMPGDGVEVEPDWVAVNDMKFTNSQTAARDSAGRQLAHVPSGARRVGEGEVWLFGFNNIRSWDARYFGPVPLANVRGVLRPLVTW
jgi:conjugative transfer signal peptidase TraF